jgi:hypothetical protein
MGKLETGKTAQNNGKDLIVWAVTQVRRCLPVVRTHRAAVRISLENATYGMPQVSTQ